MWRAPNRCLDITARRSGRCGDWVWYWRSGKQRRRLWVKPKDPRTPAQLRARAVLTAASRNYSAVLTDEQQDACIAAGAKLQTRRRMGDSGPFTGHQYYVRQQCAGINHKEAVAQLAQSEAVTRSTWGPHRHDTVVTPWPLAGRRRVFPVLRVPKLRLCVQNRRLSGFGIRCALRHAAPDQARGPPQEAVSLN